MRLHKVLGCWLILMVAVALTACATSTRSSSATLSMFVTDEIDRYLRSISFSGAVLVGRDGKVLFSRGYGMANYREGIANTPRTRFRIGSLTKQFTAAAILILQARGLLSTDDRICRYIPNCPGAWQDITIHHLLTHTSGIPNFTDFPGYQQFKHLPTTPGQMIARLAAYPLDFEPGMQYRYSNSGYVILGAIIGAVQDKTYEDFLQATIFEPLQMTDTGYEHEGDVPTVGYIKGKRKADSLDMSVPFAAGGLYSTVEDLFRWDQALYTNYPLPELLRRQMFRPYVKAGDLAGDTNYCYGVFDVQGSNGPHVVYHTGRVDGFTSAMSRFPEERTVIITLSNQETTPVLTINNQIWALVADAAKRQGP